MLPTNLSFADHAKDPRMRAIEAAMKHIHSQLILSKSWKPKGIAKLAQDILSARQAKSRKSQPKVATSASSSLPVSSDKASASVAKLKDELKAKNVRLFVLFAGPLFSSLS
jgi:iron-sulfur cluster repair protein YtfE (RIC family)